MYGLYAYSPNKLLISLYKLYVAFLIHIYNNIYL